MIKEIRIKKFRKLEDFTQNDLGKINESYGSNGCGKTTFISFITWMIYGETLDYGKNDDMNIDTFNQDELIGGEIETDNNYVFAREYGYDENGKKINDFYVNGRKTKNQNEYYTQIYNCFNVDKLSNLKIKDCNILRALSDPYYLPNNENQFRALIENLLNIDTYSILFEEEKYKDIKKDFDKQQKDYQNTKDYYNQEIKKIEKDLDITSDKIKEIKAIKFDKKEYDNLVNELNELKKSYSFSEDKELIENVNKLNSLYDDLMKSRNKDLLEKPVYEEEKQLKELIDKYDNLVNEYNVKKFKNDNNINLKNLALKNKALLENKLNEIKSKTFKEIHCPKCDTLVNEDDYKVFNKNKVEQLKQVKAEIEKVDNEIKSYKQYDLKEDENTLLSYSNEIKRLREFLQSPPSICISDETKRLETAYNELYGAVSNLRQTETIRKNQYNQEYNNKVNELQSKIDLLNNDNNKIKELDIHNKNKEILLNNKSVYELRLSKLEEYKLDEIKIIKSKTKEIFGDDFDFEMIVKNKSNDNYKKVCYASIDGLEHNKSNTAKYLKYSVMLIEKLKKYIGGCDIPLVFDIVDNIGKTARNDIFSLANSQVFYTKIADDDNVKLEIRSLSF